MRRVMRKRVFFPSRLGEIRNSPFWGVRHVRFKEWIFGIGTWIFGTGPIVASQDTMWPGHSVPLWESHSQGVRGMCVARVKSEGSPRQPEGSPRHTHSRTQERFPAAAGG